MGKMKELFFDQLDPERCQCPKNQTAMSDLCPVCLAEYEDNMMANFEALEDGELVLLEAKTERDLNEN